MMTTQAPDFGTCWGTPNGLDLSTPSYMASGDLVVIEATLRRWTTSPGQLIDDPNYGRNVYDLVSADLTPRELAYEAQQFGAEAEKDERVLSCTVQITIDVAGNVRMIATIVTAAGAFKLVLNVSAVTIDVLLVQP